MYHGTILGSSQVTSTCPAPAAWCSRLRFSSQTLGSLTKALVNAACPAAAAAKAARQRSAVSVTHSSRWRMAWWPRKAAVAKAGPGKATPGCASILAKIVLGFFFGSTWSLDFSTSWWNMKSTKSTCFMFHVCNITTEHQETADFCHHHFCLFGASHPAATAPWHLGHRAIGRPRPGVLDNCEVGLFGSSLLTFCFD